MSELPTCPVCGETDVTTTEVDERFMYFCRKCDHIWYSIRGWTAGHLIYRDAIVEDVLRSGTSEQEFIILNNTTFGRTGGMTFEEEVRQWALINRLKVTFGGPWVHFYRA